MKQVLPDKLCFVDVETTGGSLNYDRVIEIGIVRVEDHQVVKTFQSLINPNKYLPPEIELLTGITAADLDGAPSFYQLKSEIKDILKDCVFVAHNVRFDYSFLKNEFKRFDIEFNPKQICTVKLSRKLYPDMPRHNLDALIERFNLECPNRHRAFDDAQAIWQFYQVATNQFGKEQMGLNLDKIYKRPALPLGISEEDLNSLTQLPGVYIFYGDNNIPLYIGKSINIRKRVMQHFSSDHLSSIEMKISQQIKRIETIETSGELGALLKESILVKKMQPLYNRMLRTARKLTVLRAEHNQEGYLTVNLEDCLPESNFESILGIFKSRKQAKMNLIQLAKEHRLCEKLLGLENLGKECFGYRLGKCKGACIRKETSQIYNLRMQLAFAKTKLKSWPYEGAIMIEEKNNEFKTVDRFVIYNWSVIGNLVEENAEFSQEGEYGFDLDTYKILSKFIMSAKNSKFIKFLPTKKVLQAKISSSLQDSRYEDSYEFMDQDRFF